MACSTLGRHRERWSERGLYAGILAIAAGCEHNLYVEADERKNRRSPAQFISVKKLRRKLGIDGDFPHTISDADIWALASEYEME